MFGCILWMLGTTGKSVHSVVHKRVVYCHIQIVKWNLFVEMWWNSVGALC